MSSTKHHFLLGDRDPEDKVGSVVRLAALRPAAERADPEGVVIKTAG